MEDFAQFYLVGLADLLDALVHMAFWKLAAGLGLKWTLILGPGVKLENGRFV
jgi:hypothetical protein